MFSVFFNQLYIYRVAEKECYALFINIDFKQSHSIHNHELPKKIECLSYFFSLKKIKYLIINRILLLTSVNKSLKIRGL